MNKSEITQKEDYEDSLRRAKILLYANQKYKRVIRSLADNKLKKWKSSDEINDLARLGIVKLYLDKSITLSKLGRDLVKDAKK
jgi:hypothetical protein